MCGGIPEKNSQIEPNEGVGKNLREERNPSYKNNEVILSKTILIPSNLPKDIPEEEVSEGVHEKGREENAREERNKESNCEESKENFQARIGPMRKK